MRMRILASAGLLYVALICRVAAAPVTTVIHPPWTRNAVLYEVNIRQYTKRGTLAAFQKRLPALKRLGVNIIWLMPVQPIGIKNRMGRLGSYYSVRNYREVNAELGTRADFLRLIQAIHADGMHVILDWVANHTAWDNPWVKEHPDWYKKNAQGKIVSYTFRGGNTVQHWTDVVGLDYRSVALRKAMIDAMRYWVRAYGVDGFRCDAASLVPVSFWNEARTALDKVKPLFMLAEGDKPALVSHAFDMTYDWDLYSLMRKIAAGKAGAEDVIRYLTAPRQEFPRDSYRMLFTANHDTNSWDGTDQELYGAASEAMVTLTFTLPGMPLIYGGQEAGFTHRLQFFQRDPIDWSHPKFISFYENLIRLRHANPALASGDAGAPVEIIPVDNPAILRFRRRKGGDIVTVTMNLTAVAQRFDVPATPSRRILGPWAYTVSSRT